MPSKITKRDVWNGIADKTTSGLTKSQLMKNKRGTIVSIKQHQAGLRAFERNNLSQYQKSFGTRKANKITSKPHKSIPSNPSNPKQTRKNFNIKKPKSKVSKVSSKVSKVSSKDYKDSKDSKDSKVLKTEQCDWSDDENY